MQMCPLIIQLNINKKIIARYGSYIVYVYVLDQFYYKYALQMCNVHIFNKMLKTTVAWCAIYIVWSKVRLGGGLSGDIW